MESRLRVVGGHYGSKGSHVTLDAATVRLFWIGSIWTMVAVTGILAMFIVFLAGAYKSSDIMTRTGESTVGMRKDMMELRSHIQGYLGEMKGHFPPNQVEQSIRQLTGSIENMQRISARVALLLESVDPRRAAALGAHLQTIAEGVTVEDVHRLSAAAATLAEHVGAMSAEADRSQLVAHVNAVVQNLGAVAQQINKMHEITLAWGKHGE